MISINNFTNEEEKFYLKHVINNTDEFYRKYQTIQVPTINRLQI